MKRQTKPRPSQGGKMHDPVGPEDGIDVCFPYPHYTPRDFLKLPTNDNEKKMRAWARERFWSVVPDGWDLSYLVVDEKGRVALAISYSILATALWEDIENLLVDPVPEEARMPVAAPERDQLYFLLRTTFEALGIDLTDGERFDHTADLVFRRGLELLAARSVLSRLADPSQPGSGMDAGRSALRADRELARIERFPAQFQTVDQFQKLCDRVKVTSQDVPASLFRQMARHSRPAQRPPGGYDPTRDLTQHIDDKGRVRITQSRSIGKVAQQKQQAPTNKVYRPKDDYEPPAIKSTDERKSLRSYSKNV